MQGQPIAFWLLLLAIRTNAREARWPEPISSVRGGNSLFAAVRRNGCTTAQGFGGRYSAGWRVMAVHVRYRQPELLCVCAAPAA